MPPPEFARFGTVSPRPVAPVPAAATLAAAQPLADAPAPIVAAAPSVRMLLLEGDPVLATDMAALLADGFGEHFTLTVTPSIAEAEQRLASHLDDVYLIGRPEGGGRLLERLQAAIERGPLIPAIVIAPDGTGSDLEALEAGAADVIPRRDLSASVLKRAIRHALVRQAKLAAAQQAIAGLTEEKTRLNALRDSNHRFVENACHDFRSPLTVIKEFAAIIVEGLAGDVNEEQTEFLNIILTRVDHLSHMVDGILDASRLESDVIGVRRDEHLVAALVEQARTPLEQRAAAQNVSISFDVPVGIPNVFADADSISRVITNLGTNACKYVGEGGKIRVWARYDAERHEVQIGVTDNGPGITPEHVKIIFDRFQQTGVDKAAEKGGFGLGLHIASELVRVNFGTLSVESEPNKGSTFCFTLPVFDVNALIPLHFGYLRTSRHGFQKVSIALARAATEDAATAAEVERALNRQLRSYDLMLRLGDGQWLVCVACDEEGLPKITGRILDAYNENNRHRRDARLPDVVFRPVGTWSIANRPEGLTDAINGAYQLAPERRAVVH